MYVYIRFHFEILNFKIYNNINFEFFIENLMSFIIKFLHYLILSFEHLKVFLYFNMKTFKDFDFFFILVEWIFYWPDLKCFIFAICSIDSLKNKKIFFNYFLMIITRIYSNWTYEWSVRIIINYFKILISNGQSKMIRYH